MSGAPEPETASALSSNDPTCEVLADLLPVGVFVDSVDGRARYVNSALCRMSGYAASELMALPARARYAQEEDLERLGHLVLREGSVRGFETVAVRKDGARYRVRISASLVRGDAGAEWVVGVVEAVSEEQRARLEPVERAVPGAFRAGLGLSSLSRLPTGTFVDANDGFLKFTGYSRDEVVGRTAEELGLWFHPEQRQEFERRVRSEGAVHAMEMACRRKNGQLAYALLEATILSMDRDTYLLVLGIDATQRTLAEEALLMVMHSMEAAPQATYCIDSTGTIVYVNDAGCRALGYKREELLHQNVSLIDPLMTRERGLEGWRVLEQQKKFSFESQQRKKDGTLFSVDVTCSYFESNGKGYCHTYAVDITERRRAEQERKSLREQLFHAQKMESIGRLAGGVAHDFNNMLTVILGQTELILAELEPDSQQRRDLEEVRQAAVRSVELTRQLLAFARRQTSEPKVLDLNRSVSGMLNMLRRLIGESIELEWRPGKDVWPVRIDPSQLHQILANLCINARDAVDGLGKITISTDNRWFHPDGQSTELDGAYAKICVVDTGCGMDEETMSHLFEPFFTTKDVGRGTGLGLASVYGIVRQNQGSIEVRSHPGEGATFTIYLPRHHGEEAQGAGVPSSTRSDKTRGTVLLVEDEAAVAGVERRMLEHLGYDVVVAESAREAIRIIETQGGRIRLVVLDVIMPEMNGRDLATRLTRLRPGLRILFVSGYPADALADLGVLNPGIRVLEKPLTTAALSAKIDELIEN